MKDFNREKAILEGVIHQENHSRNLQRLNSFYGKVAKDQNCVIARHCLGNTVLDVGAGYGNLTLSLLRAGKIVNGIEVDEEKILKAREWLGVKLHFSSLFEWDGKADTVIFREVINHLDIDLAFKKAYQLSNYRCLVFQGTEVFPLKIAKKIYGHYEYRQKRIDDIIKGLESAGFSVQGVIYRDLLAYPLSGGWHGTCFVSSIEAFQNFLIKMDHELIKIARFFKLDSLLSYRALIVADKSTA